MKLVLVNGHYVQTRLEKPRAATVVLQIANEYVGFHLEEIRTFQVVEQRLLAVGITLRHPPEPQAEKWWAGILKMLIVERSRRLAGGEQRKGEKLEVAGMSEDDFTKPRGDGDGGEDP